MTTTSPPTSMPCPVCGDPASVRSVGTAMTDDALNIQEATVYCDTHGWYTWTFGPPSRPRFPSRILGLLRRW